jgi:hypothetical protein
MTHDFSRYRDRRRATGWPVAEPYSSPSRRDILAWASAGLVVAVWPAPTGAAAPPGPLAGPLAPPPAISFEVVALGNRIGEHQVGFAGDGGQFTARSLIDIDARVLGVRLFRYRQVTSEIWSGGRLQAFTSEGDDDGQAFKVSGQSAADGFVVDGRNGRIVAPVDIMLATYWTPLMLSRSQVINPKRGNLKPQTVRSLGQASVVVAGTPRAANRFAITGVLDGTVVYDSEGRWVGASFDRKGATIDYRLAG